MKSLYVKFTITTIAIMLVSSLLAFMFSNFYYQQTLKQYNDEKNTVIAENIVNYATTADQISLTDYLEHTASIGYQLFLIDQSGKGTFFGAPFRNDHLEEQTIKSVLNGNVYHGMAQYPQETFVTGFFANELTNTIGVPLVHNDKQYALFIRPNIKLLFNEMHILLTWLLVITIILSIIFVLISTKFLVRPITTLTKATDELSRGNFSVKLDIGRKDELGKLAHSFTHMVKQLEKHDDMKNEFIANISHDIQSPLSNIKGYAHLLEKETLNKKDKETFLTIINKEVNRLSNLTKQLLLLASLDNQELSLNKTTFSLSELLKEVIFTHQWLIQEQNLMISYTLPDTYIIGDRNLLYNVWDNLLTNAIKYNQVNGSIVITITEQENQVIITLQDTGIGISNQYIDRIFDRFYREDSARTRDIEGTGLGLSIVSSIITLHDGQIKIDSKKNIGTTISVYLPKI